MDGGLTVVAAATGASALYYWLHRRLAALEDVNSDATAVPSSTHPQPSKSSSDYMASALRKDNGQQTGRASSDEDTSPLSTATSSAPTTPRSGVSAKSTSTVHPSQTKSRSSAAPSASGSGGTEVGHSVASEDVIPAASARSVHFEAKFGRLPAAPARVQLQLSPDRTQARLALLPPPDQLRLNGHSFRLRD